jgi:Protein of unknown function (DUF3352)
LLRVRVPALLLACVAVPAAILAGCGGGGDGGGGSSDVGPAAAAPANSALYLDATVKPTGTAQSDAKAALSKILNTPDPGAKIVSLIEKQSKADGHPINYQQDVAPWLGEKAGVFFTSLGDTTQHGAAVVETNSPAASLAFAQKAAGASAANPAPQTYNGATYQTDPSSPSGPDQTVFGTVDNKFLVEGDLDGFKAAVDASKGDSLGDDGDFEDAIGDLPSDRLGTLYTVPKDFIDALGPDQFDAQSKQQLEAFAGDSLDEPVAGALTATADDVQLDATGGSNGLDTPESSLIGTVPSQSWLAFGVGDLGNTVKHTIDQFKDQIPNFDAVIQQIQSTTGSSLDQLEAALGDAVIYVQGTTQSTLAGALVVHTNDPDLTGRLVSQLQGLLQLGSGGVKPLGLSGGGTGFQINDPTVAPRPVEIAQQGDKLVIGYGANSAEQSLTPAQTLSDAPSFSAAHGQMSSLGTDLFLDLPSVFALAESSGAKSDPQYLQAKPYLDSLRYLVTGSGSKGDQAEFKAIVGLK